MEVIRLNQVSLTRRTQEELTYDLKKTILSLLEGKYRKPARKLVLDKIDFAINRGEKVGIIGANGSGKSTLLKVISGILQPTSGSLWIRGRISPLIELGAGFDPNMSVMSNIVLYGVLLGYSRTAMLSKADSILEFADLQGYATVPVKALSSGMVARLGFSIATDVQPEILILDEVLAVGDESFRQKSQKRMRSLWDGHATVLVVSHDLNEIQRSCNRAIWLDRGRIRYIGRADEAVANYLDAINNGLDMGLGLTH